MHPNVGTTSTYAVSEKEIEKNIHFRRDAGTQCDDERQTSGDERHSSRPRHRTRVEVESSVRDSNLHFDDGLAVFSHSRRAPGTELLG